MKKIKEIKVNTIYRHRTGLLYRVDDLSVHDVTGYENGGKPKEIVLYTQLEKGKYPAGKKWVREKNDFLKHFVESGDEV